MFWRILLVLVVTAAIGLTGCKKEEPKSPVEQAVQDVQDEAEAAADEVEDVDVEAEVDKMEKEVEADMEK